MWVERGEHPVDRRLDQFGGINLFDILGANALEDIAEEIELFVDRGVAVGFLRDQRARDLRGCQKTKHRASCSGQGKFLHIESYLTHTRTISRG